MAFGEFSMEINQLDELDDYIDRLENQNKTLKQKIEKREAQLQEQELCHKRALAMKRRDLKTAVKIIEKGRQILREERELRTTCEEKLKTYENELIRVNSLLVCREIEKASYETKLVGVSSSIHRCKVVSEKDEGNANNYDDWFEQYLVPSQVNEKSDEYSSINITNIIEEYENPVSPNDYISTSIPHDDGSNFNRQPNTKEFLSKKLRMDKAKDWAVEKRLVINDKYVAGCIQEMKALLEFNDLAYLLERKPLKSNCYIAPNFSTLPTIDSLIQRKETLESLKYNWIRETSTNSLQFERGGDKDNFRVDAETYECDTPRSWY